VTLALWADPAGPRPTRYGGCPPCAPLRHRALAFAANPARPCASWPPAPPDSGTRPRGRLVFASTAMTNPGLRHPPARPSRTAWAAGARRGRATPCGV